ncbi:MAG: hypothetical protein ACTHJ6_00110 [Oryzihumus sp.]
MSYHLWVNLRPQDRAEGSRGDAGSCLLAVALQRQYGGEWSVSGAIQQTVGGEITWQGRTTVQGNAIIARFDTTATAKTNRRVRIARGTGKYRNRPPRRVEQPQDGCVRNARWQGPNQAQGRLVGAALAAGSLALILDGLAWVLLPVFIILAGGLITLIVRSHKAGNKHLAAQAAEPQKYVHVQPPKRTPEPEPTVAGPAPLGRETLYASAPPEPITDPVPAAAPAREPVPATTGGAA